MGKEKTREEEMQEMAAIAQDQKALQEKTRFKPVAVESSDWDLILEDYMKKFPGRKSSDDGSLSFTQQEAEDFFTEQAKQNRSFFGTWITAGKIQDDHLFSCGTGIMYKGNIAKIEQEISDALRAEPNPDTDTAIKLTQGLARIATYKPRLQAALAKEQMQAQREADKQQSTAPTPTATTPAGR